MVLLGLLPACSPIPVGRNDAGLSGGSPGEDGGSLGSDGEDGSDDALASVGSEISASGDDDGDDGSFETGDDGTLTTGPDPTSAGDSQDDGVSTNPGSSDDGPIDGTCPGAELGGTLPAVANGTNAGAVDQLVGNCGAQGGLDVSFAFTAPADATYRVDTMGSNYDTVLYVLDGDDCSGSVLACNDDDGGYQSKLDLALQAGQRVVVVVDAYGGATGDFVLTVDEVPLPCQPSNLGQVAPIDTSSSTASNDDTVQGSCGGAGAPDAVFAWTAPSAGTYTISTAGSALDTVLYAFDGADCLGTELGCNDDRAADDPTSELQLTLAAGQTIAIAVDGADGQSGPFSLAID